MRKIFLIIACTLVLPGSGQPPFKTVVPQEPIVAGQPFRVQFIWQGEGEVSTVHPPAFLGFRLISGPDVYSGEIKGLHGAKAVRNFVYTIEAGQPGNYIVNGATILLNGRIIKSNDAEIKVISPEDASRYYRKTAKEDNSDYFLAPGEDPYEKIRRNLFLKVSVDKRNCFVGEPVVATYKLYSRLESRSDIVKNPGFYGFAVFDMVNLADREQSTEEWNGRAFDVHTIRKVQLYPLQAGVFEIDPMEVKNEVEFSRSAVNKKTEQEIVEGLSGGSGNESFAVNSLRFDNQIHTDPVSITVRPLTEKNKPAGYNGAVGHFKVRVSAPLKTLAKNQQGHLEITLSGAGNFIQLSAPSVNWPSGIEAFDPEVSDSLDKKRSPLTGSRTFRFGFVSSRPGEYTIPSTSFSFFDPDSGRYRTVTAPSLTISITDRWATGNPVPGGGKNNQKGNRQWLPAAATIGILLLFALVYVHRRNRKSAAIDRPVVPATVRPSVDELLSTAALLLFGGDHDFYAQLRKAIWIFFGYYFHLSGSGISKEKLFKAMNESEFPEPTIRQTGELLRQVEEGLFTRADLLADKKELLETTRRLMKEIQARFHSEYL